MGKIQAISGTLDQPAQLANIIVQTLLRSSRVRGQMRRALVVAFENSKSFAVAKMLENSLVAIEDFTNEEKDRIREACANNRQVAGSWGVPESIYAVFGAPAAPQALPANPGDDVPF